MDKEVDALVRKLMQENAALRARVDRMEADLSGFTIVGCSGNGPRGMSVSFPPAASNGAAYPLTLCDGTEITVAAANVTPP